MPKQLKTSLLSRSNSSTPLLRSESKDLGTPVNYHTLGSSPGLTPNELSTSSVTSSRRPYHYPLDQQNVGQLSFNIGNQDLYEASVTYNRYRYYTRLSGPQSGSVDNCSRLQIPDHVIPWYFYVPRIAIQLDNNTLVTKVRKQSSFVTIFAIWNMLMGTSLLCLPWALSKAGLVCGFVLLFSMTALCFYTADLIISIPKMVKLNVIEFSDAVYNLLGRTAHILSIFSSLVTLFGGCIVYWVLMSNFLEHIFTFLYQTIDQNATVSTNMSEVICEPKSQNITNSTTSGDNLLFNDLNQVVPILLAVLMTPVISLKSVNFFMKFNIVGSISVIYLLIFSAYKAFKWGPINVDFSDQNNVNYTKLFDWNFPAMSGILGLALFIHNCVISLLRTNRNQHNNRRDLGIAYILVASTYLLIASLIYISFPISKDCLKDNFLDNFESNDVLAFITRAFLFIQVFSLFPLLVLMLRIQIMHLLIPNTSPGYCHIISLNAVLVTLCVSFAIYFPHIGTIIRYVGSFSALIYIFSLPPIAYLKAKRLTGQHIPIVQYIFLYTIVIIGFANFFSQFLIN